MLNYYIHVSVPLITDFNYVRVYHCSIDTSCKISDSKRMEALYAWCYLSSPRRSMVRKHYQYFYTESLSILHVPSFISGIATDAGFFRVFTRAITMYTLIKTPRSYNRVNRSASLSYSLQLLLVWGDSLSECLSWLVL